MADGFSGLLKLLSTSEIPYVHLNQERKPIEWNAQAEEIFPSLSKDGFIDRILANLEVADAEVLRNLVSDNIPFFSFEFPGKTGTDDRRWFKFTQSRLKDGSYLAIFDNITDHKQREQLLLDAKTHAEKAIISRSQFMANISHEIRTPIQTIIGMMELLVDTKLDEEQTEYVRQVRFSADVMLTLINDILDFSKVEAGQMKIERIELDLSTVIERTVDLVSMEAHKKGLEICIDISPELPETVLGDPSRLQQVILNLVKNAVKFTEKGFILVSARALALDDPSVQVSDTVHFEVVDTGIGITTDAQKKLFTEFFQADASTTRKYGGTGLGLAISRNIVELMHGHIGVKNNENKGATFWFDLPFPKAEKQPTREKLKLSEQTRFLIVDDNELTISLLRRMLVSMGYTNITGVVSGKQALDALSIARKSSKPFDIVLIDMIMPEMDGWRLAAEINKNREINQAQLYLMVPEGSFGADAKMKLLEWFNGYLYKPIKKRKLAELLREHWQSSIDLEIVEELEASEPETIHAIDEPLPKEAPSAESPGKGLVVLIAEDHPVNRKLLKIILEKAGATVITAEDGQYATEAIEKEKVDLIFMDIQMPRLNGYEASSWIRDKGYTVPIIACTASAQENEKERCLSFGMTDILPKPYRKQEVIDIMLQYTEAHDAKEHLESQNIFDSQSFFDIMMGDTDAAKALMGEFLSQTESHLEILEEDILTGNLDAAAKTSHLIKGSSLNVTAGSLADAALIIENGATSLPREGLLAAAERMRKELSLLRERLNEEGYL
jgi:signal transduction histidine kinase/CheY-like chemotaxis protein/HPt (histidine-containing phosphotransfer) domain-containing protein